MVTSSMRGLLFSSRGAGRVPSRVRPSPPRGQHLGEVTPPADAGAQVPGARLHRPRVGHGHHRRRLRRLAPARAAPRGGGPARASSTTASRPARSPGITSVEVKMETPVTYFYSDKPRTRERVGRLPRRACSRSGTRRR